MKIPPALVRLFHLLNLSPFKGFPGITGISGSRLVAIILFALMCFTLPLSAEQFSTEKVFVAVARNEIDTVRKALNSGFDVNAMNGEVTLLGAALFEDIKHHSRKEIILLILQSPKIKVNTTSTFHIKQSDVEESPLITASEKGMTDIVEILLKKGANINARRIVDGNITFSSLMAAAGSGHMETVRMLLKYKPDVNFKDRYGRTALDFAIKWENLEMVKMLHEAGIKINRLIDEGNSILTLTFYHEKFEVLDYLIAEGADINLAGPKGYTVLMYACLNKHEDWFIKKFKYDPLRFHKKIMSLKPNVNYVNLNGTALHQAVQSNMVDRVKFLLDNGANLNLLEGALGQTPLTLSVAIKRIPMVKYLVERGADTTIPDQEGETPLTHAIFLRNKEMIDILRKGGASFKNQKVSALSMLSYFAACADPNPLDHKKNLGIIKDTLDCELNPNYQSPSGKTGLMAVVTEEYFSSSQGLDKAKLLIKKGASPDIADKKGVTALILAASKGNLELVQLMVDNGANINIKDNAGQTANSYAIQSGKNKVTKYLSSKGATPDSGSSAKSTTNPFLLGSWHGMNSQKPRTLCYLTLESNNRFDFQYRNISNKVIEKQTGTYTAQKDTLIFIIPGKEPLTRKWKYSDGFLYLDKIIQLQKIE